MVPCLKNIDTKELRAKNLKQITWSPIASKNCRCNKSVENYPIASKLQSNQSERRKFRTILWSSCHFRRFGNEQILEAMIGHHYEKAENKM